MERPATSSPLRARRLDCGLTQAQLAARAGVSRQLVAAVESGQNTPAVDAAVRLARALSSTVELLFGGPCEEAVRPALGDLPEGAPLRIGRVGPGMVAAELPDHGTAAAGWAAPDGVIRDGVLRLFGGGDLRGLVLAGCDPALGLAESMLGGLGPSSLRTLSAPTGTALASLARGAIHAAVVHGPSDLLPSPPVAVLRLHLARWQVGLAVDLGAGARDLESVLAEGVPIVQRDPAAASQLALERAAQSLGAAVPPGPRAAGHIDAARRAALSRSAAVTTESAARAFGLRFAALEEHTVQVWVALVWEAHPGVQALGGLLTASAFTDRLAQVGGYDLTGCGSQLQSI